jgi:hypothetical protein
VVEMAYLKEKKFLVRVVVLAAVAGLFVGAAITYAVMQWTWKISTVATLKLMGVGVYKDVNFTVPVSEIDWGIVELSEKKNFSAYIKNESNVPITLTMHTEDWSPLNASSFISLSWDYSGSEIPVDGSIPVTFILNVDAATSGIESFSFTIVIVGSG